METMSLPEVCKLLKITEQTGRNRLSEELPMPPSFKVGRRRLFLTLEVESWLLKESGFNGRNQPTLNNSEYISLRGRPKKTKNVLSEK
jgi:hypothetical protein